MDSDISSNSSLDSSPWDFGVLPHRPPSICQTCWDGPMSARLGLFHAPIRAVKTGAGWRYTGGCSFSVSKTQLGYRIAGGCVWCTFLRRIIRRKTEDAAVISGTWWRYPLKITLGIEDVYQHCTPYGLQSLSVVINDERIFSGYIHTAADNPAASHIVARNPTLDVGSLYALSAAKSCVEECVSTHQCCNAISVSRPPFPTRLIDCTDPKRPRVISTEGGCGRYLALSYVWGETQPHQTTTHNVSMYSDGIDPSLLPRTIRDAIYVTHTLGLRYLWADSLCIIQDSLEDQRHEIARMHLIYRNAYLTIIAASAERVSEGFLQCRPLSPPDITLPFICPPPSSPAGDIALEPSVEAQVGEVHVSQAFQHAGTHARLIPEPISVRGWCLQEYYMSPRALIFTSEALLVRCQTTTQNIGGAFYNPVAAQEQRLPDVLFLPDPAPAATGSEEWNALCRTWCNVVGDYTRRTVGKPSDKLVACGAIAEAFQRVFSSGYLAGLWRDTLSQDLLWQKRLGTYLRRAAAYRAPSWSWAAVDGEVWMWRRDLESRGGVVAVAQVVRCQVVLKDPQLRFGELTDGLLVVRAVLVRCKLRPAYGSLGSHDILLPSVDAREDSTGDDTAPREDKRLPGGADIDCKADAGIPRASLIPFWRTGRDRVQGLVVVLADADGVLNPDGDTVFRRIGVFDVKCEWDTLHDYSSVTWAAVGLV